MTRAVAALGVAMLSVGGLIEAQVPRPAAPARDTAAASPKGTAVIRGRVIAADGEAPLPRVAIRISGAALPQALTVNTNSKGIYAARNLPAGRYTLTASRSGYLSMQNGQRYPEEPGRPIDLPDGGELAVDFALPRGSVISGRVTDETGDTVPSIHVWAMQERFFQRERKLVPVHGGGLTDDTGQYRITSLAPGDYILMTVLRETWTSKGEDKLVYSYAPTYYPSTASLPEAQRVTVGIGLEVSAIDITLVPVRAAVVSGSATLADGTPLSDASVRLSHTVGGPQASSMWSIGSATTSAEGTWSISNVPPGDFELELNAADPKRGTFSASGSVSVHGADVTGVILTPAAPVSVSGTVVTDDGQPLPNSPRLRVMPENLRAGRPPLVQPPPEASGSVTDDGRFTYGGVVPGPTLLRIPVLPQGWGVKHVFVGDRDHAEVPFDIRSAQPIAGVQIVLSRQLSSVEGGLVNEQGQAADGTVLFFPTDPAKWHESAGALRHARPDQNGRFRFATVRPGEYFVIALDYVQAWQVSDPQFLESLRRRATKIQVIDGENEPLRLAVQR